MMDIFDHRAMWLMEAKNEALKQRSLKNHRGKGSCVLFILDTSESMQAEGIQSLKKGVTDILDEFRKHPLLDENVSVITFGNETRFLHYYSNNYAPVKQSIENLECSGPSPLTAALLLALGGLFEGSAHTQKVGDFLLPPRVVLFTDGRPTDISQEHASEQEGQGDLDNSIKAPLLSAVHYIGKRHPIFCFPVGKNPNRNLLNAISLQSSGGRVLGIDKARWFGRYSLHYETAERISKITTNEGSVEREVLKTFLGSVMSWENVEEDDVETIYELINDKSRIMARQSSREETPDDKFYKEKYSTVPKLGTRVRRGPHWSYQNQDSEGPGTIVGHGDSDGLVYVEWDTGLRANYSHGHNGIYHVVVCDEPRFPVDGLAAVGCFVKRGPDWKWEEQDGGVGSIGTVYKAMDDATVYVRWPCGRKANYRFGCDGKFDIDVCDPFSPEVIQAVKEQQEDAKYSHPDRNSSNEFKGNVTSQKTSGNVGTKDDYKRSTEQMKSESTNFDDSKTESSINLNSIERPNFDRLHIPRSESPNVEKESATNFGVRNTAGSFPLTTVDDRKTEFKFTVENSLSDIETDGCPEAYGTCSASVDEYHNDLLLKDVNGDRDSASAIDERPFVPRDSLPESIKNVEKERGLTLSSPKIGNSVINADRWEWMSSDGVWVDYPDHVNNQINCRLQQHPNTSVVVCYNDQCFRVIVSKSIQINTGSKERHRIRLKKD
ncbi:uncharacterized protein LOC111128778 isoform X2 [Crassostrea virginica]